MQFEKKRYSDFLNQTKTFLRFQKRMMIFAATAAICAFAAVFYLFVQSTSQEFDPSLVVWMLGASSFFIMMSGILCYVSLKTQKMWLNSQKQSDTPSPEGLVSLSFFDEMLEEEVRRASRYHYPLTMCKLELDDYKSIEKNFGQQQAAEHLENFSRLMQGTIRESDRLVQCSEQKFCVLLPHTDMVRSEKFISRALELSSANVDCSFSAGLTPYRAGENKNQFFARANTALQHAQKDGKSRVCCVIGKDDQQMVVQF